LTFACRVLDPLGSERQIRSTRAAVLPIAKRVLPLTNAALQRGEKPMPYLTSRSNGRRLRPGVSLVSRRRGEPSSASISSHSARSSASPMRCSRIRTSRMATDTRCAESRFPPDKSSARHSSSFSRIASNRPSNVTTNAFRGHRQSAWRQWSGFDVRYQPTTTPQCERQIQSSTRINILPVVLQFLRSQTCPPRWDANVGIGPPASHTLRRPRRGTHIAHGNLKM
jgi:hypothetical protein